MFSPTSAHNKEIEACQQHVEYVSRRVGRRKVVVLPADFAVRRAINCPKEE
jgi:hypothetical protein